MSILKLINWHYVALLGLVLFGAGTRLIPYDPELKQLFPGWWNFMPIGAIALFGGACFSNRLTAFIVPLAALLLSDVLIARLLGSSVFYGWTMPVVYACFVVYALLGMCLCRGRKVGLIIVGSLAGSVQFFIFTNFAVWASSNTLYAKTWDGLLQCYVAAVPFFRGTLIGDAAYVVVLFGGLALAQWAFPTLRESAASPQRVGAEPQAA